MPAQAQLSMVSLAGKLWDEGNFPSMKMDQYCKEIKEVLDSTDNNEHQPM
jgi:hypothetical protein